MAKETFTDGPWSIRMPKDGHSRAKIDAEGWVSLARVVVSMKMMSGELELNKEGLANAALICAAPDMYVMLQDTLSLLEPMANNPVSELFMDRLRATILKATPHA